MDFETIDKINEEAGAIALDLLSEKSRDKYINTYNKFLAWKNENNFDNNCFSEDVMLAYFDFLKIKYKASSMCVEFSMLKTVIQRNHNVDINQGKLNLLLKKNLIGYQPRKPNIFQPHEIRKFISEADDKQYLVAKVIMIFGMYGATLAESLTKVDIRHVRVEGNVCVIKVPEKNRKFIRSFTVECEYATYVRKYMKLRPTNVSHNRFFINYQHGKCTLQPIGRNKFLATPKIIAEFLKLEDAENYTGHSFRTVVPIADGDAGNILMAKETLLESDQIMSTITVQDFSKICRFCTNQSTNLKLIFKNETPDQEQSISKMFLECLNLDVSIDTKVQLPPFICCECNEKLFNCYNFRKQCIESCERLCEIYVNEQATVESSRQYDIEHIDVDKSFCECESEIKQERIDTDDDDNKSLNRNDIINCLEGIKQERIDTDDYDNSSLNRNDITNCLEGIKKERIDSDDDNSTSNRNDITNCLEELNGLDDCNESGCNDLKHEISVNDVEEKWTVKCNKSMETKKKVGRTEKLITEKVAKAPEMCQTCGGVYVDLKSHMFVHDQTPKFECDYCGKKFKHKRNLFAHVRIHNNYRKHQDIGWKFECDYCGSKFKHKSNISAHVQIHVNSRKQQDIRSIPIPGSSQVSGRFKNS